MDGQAIVAALDHLHAAFPKELVQIWVGYSPEGKEEVTARVGEPPSFHSADSPAAAVSGLLLKVDSMKQWRQNKIKSLKEEISRIEAQL